MKMFASLYPSLLTMIFHLLFSVTTWCASPSNIKIKSRGTSSNDMSYEYTPGISFDPRPRWAPDYHNIGFVTSPYPRKIGQGDWSVVQSPYENRTGIYQTVKNATYPYPVDGAGHLTYCHGEPRWSMFSLFDQ